MSTSIPNIAGQSPNSTRKYTASMRHLAGILLLTLLSIAAFAVPPKDEGTHNGLWWLHKTGTYRNAYVVGYLEASVDTHSNGIPANIDLSLENARLWVQGINTFYDDFRNRAISVSDALQYVHDQLNNATDESLAAKLKTMRQTAAARGGDN